MLKSLSESLNYINNFAVTISITLVLISTIKNYLKYVRSTECEQYYGVPKSYFDVKINNLLYELATLMLYITFINIPIFIISIVNSSLFSNIVYRYTLKLFLLYIFHIYLYSNYTNLYGFVLSSKLSFLVNIVFVISSLLITACSEHMDKFICLTIVLLYSIVVFCLLVLLVLQHIFRYESPYYRRKYPILFIGNKKFLIVSFLKDNNAVVMEYKIVPKNGIQCINARTSFENRLNVVGNKGKFKIVNLMNLKLEYKYFDKQNYDISFK